MNLTLGLILSNYPALGLERKQSNLPTQPVVNDGISSALIDGMPASRTAVGLGKLLTELKISVILAAYYKLSVFM